MSSFGHVNGPQFKPQRRGLPPGHTRRSGALRAYNPPVRLAMTQSKTSVCCRVSARGCAPHGRARVRCLVRGRGHGPRNGLISMPVSLCGHRPAPWRKPRTRDIAANRTHFRRRQHATIGHEIAATTPTIRDRRLRVAAFAGSPHPAEMPDAFAVCANVNGVSLQESCSSLASSETFEQFVTDPLVFSGRNSASRLAGRPETSCAR
jgi:hypothetical protein